MPIKEKARQDAEPIPYSVRQDNSESKASPEFAQALMRSVFGRDYVVIRAPVPKRNPMADGDISPSVRITGPKPSRIRSWRAENLHRAELTKLRAAGRGRDQSASKTNDNSDTICRPRRVAGRHCKQTTIPNLIDNAHRAVKVASGGDA